MTSQPSNESLPCSEQSERSERRSEHGSGAKSLPDPQAVVKGKRRRFSAEYKMRILEQADCCTEQGQIGLLLRQEGLYSSQLATWRRWRRRMYPEHPTSQKPASSATLRHERDRLSRENARLQMKLEKAEGLIELQKKLALILDNLQPQDSEGSKP